MKYPTFVPTLAPSIYNGGIKLYQHEFDYGHKYASEASNVYSWIETLLEKKYKVGKQYDHKGQKWTVAYIGDRSETVIEVCFVRTEGKHLLDDVMTIPRNQCAAVHRDI